MDHLVHLPFTFFLLRSAGDLMTRLNSNATVREMLTSGALSTLLDGSLVLLYLGLLLAGSPRMGALVFGLALLQVLVFVFASRRQRELMAKNLEVSASAQNYQVEVFSGIQTLKALGLEDKAVQHWSNLYVDVLNVSLERGRLEALTESITSTLRMASPLVVMGTGALLVMEGQLTMGEMLALNALAAGFLLPVSNLVTTAFQLQLVRSYLTRVDDVLQAPPEQVPGTRHRAHSLQGRIQVENVSFRYGVHSPQVV
uniref:ABC transporter transmembrane domain-containing protein n=1 Tax=Corallococcus coralloides TaxID=184914 RepID=UPI003204B0A6